MKTTITIVIFLFVALFATGAVKFCFKTIRFSFDCASLINFLGLFFIVLGLCIFAGYNRHIGQKESGYWEGYKDAIDDAIEVLNNNQLKDESK